RGAAHRTRQAGRAILVALPGAARALGACARRRAAVVAPARRRAAGGTPDRLLLGRAGRDAGRGAGARRRHGATQRAQPGRALHRRRGRGRLSALLRRMAAASARAGGMKNRLRELRKAHGLSQAELAEAVEVSRQTIIAVEADKYDPSLPMAYKLAAFFGVAVEALFFNPFVSAEAE